MRTYQPGPQGQAPAVTWRQWLLPLGAAAGIVALATMSRGTPLSYSRFLADVGAGSVCAVTVDPAGQVVGRLTTGQPFTTTIPVALDDRTLAGRLAAHHVQVTATVAMPSTPVPLLIGLLLLVMIGGLFYVGVRGARRDIGGLRGPPGTGKTLLARASVRWWLWQLLRRSLTMCWFCYTGSRARRPTGSR
jgi:ATP-dependent Zn protease